MKAAVINDVRCSLQTPEAPRARALADVAPLGRRDGLVGLRHVALGLAGDDPGAGEGQDAAAATAAAAVGGGRGAQGIHRQTG